MAIKVSIIEAKEGTSESVAPRFHDYQYMKLEQLLFAEGVIDTADNDLKVTERGAGANMTVDVAAGTSLVEITNTATDGTVYNVYLFSDALVNVPVPTADGTFERIDRIIAKVDVSIVPNTTSSNLGTIELVEGTPAGSPSAPPTPADSISLATISVPASDTTISNAQITDTRAEVDMASTTTLPDLARASILASTSNGEGASLVGIEDSAALYTATNVEDALAEVRNAIPAEVDTEIFGNGSDGALSVTSGTTTIDVASANFIQKNYTTFLLSGGTLDFTNVPNDGCVVVFRVQQNCTLSGGLLDGALGGSLGGAAPTPATKAGNGNAIATGNNATNPGHSMGLTKAGGAGQTDVSGDDAAASGGGSGANVLEGNAASAASANTASAVGGLRGAATTVSELLRAMFGLNITCGAGSGSGSGVVNVFTGYASGTFTATPGKGGRGGMTFVFIVGGNYDDSGGEIDTSAEDGDDGTLATGSASQYSVAVSGGGGGTAGDINVLYKGSAVVTGTHTMTAGNGGNSDEAGFGGGIGDGTDGANGIAGKFQASKMILGT